MSIYTEGYQDSIEFGTKITTKKGGCILAVFTNTAERVYWHCQEKGMLHLSYDKNLYKILITRGGDRRHEQTSDSGNTRFAAA